MEVSFCCVIHLSYMEPTSSLPTDIQQDGIPAILGGADVCMVKVLGNNGALMDLFRLPKLVQEKRVLSACRFYRLSGRR